MNTNTLNESISFNQIIKPLIKNKWLIFFSVIIGLLLGIFFHLIIEKEYESRIVTNGPPHTLFLNYSKTKYEGATLNRHENNKCGEYDVTKSLIINEFNYKFNLNFLSIDLFSNFIKENKSINANFLNLMKKDNLSLKSYFQNDKLLIYKDKGINICGTYVLYYPKELKGKDILDQYANYIRDYTIKEVKNTLYLSIKNEIAANRLAFKIAKKLNIEKPVFENTKSQGLDSSKLVSDTYLSGYSVIEEKIKFLESQLTLLEKEQFKYNPVKDSATEGIIRSDSLNLKFIILISIFLSLLFSFSWVIIREASRNIK